MSRKRWVRHLPGEADCLTDTLHAYFNLFYDDHLNDDADHQSSWFPPPSGFFDDPRHDVHFTHPDDTAPIVGWWNQGDHGAPGSSRYVPGRWLMTEALWERFQWNPRVIYIIEDNYLHADGYRGQIRRRKDIPFTLYSKPSWSDILDMERDWQIAWAERDNPGVWNSEALGESRDALLSTPLAHSTLKENLHTGGGLAHMPALAYRSNRSAAAGVSQSRVIMREQTDDPAPRLVELWTEAERHDLLEPLAERTNYAESARNVIWNRLWAVESKIYDPHGGLADTATEGEIKAAKRQAIDDWHQMVDPNTLDAAMADEITRLTRLSDLPEDLSRAKRVLAERIEAAAMKRVKEIKGAESQQGVDVPATCLDMERALEQVSQHCALGIAAVREITATLWKKTGITWSVTTDDPPEVQHTGESVPLPTLGADGDYYRETGIGAARDALEEVVSNIEGVTPLNVPVWKVNGTAVSTDEVEEAGRSLTVCASHPADTAIAGSAMITSSSGTGTVSRPAGDKTSQQMAVDIPAGATFPMELTFFARNLCGPSKLKVTLTGP